MGKIKKIFSEIVELFHKDTTAEGESNKLIVVMRTIEFFIVIYSLVNIIYTGTKGYYDALFCFLVIFVSYFIFIHMSYHLSIKSQVALVNCYSLGCVLVAYWLFGSNTLAQSYFVVLTILCYFTGYGHYKIKALYALFVGGVYLFVEVFLPEMIPTVLMPINAQNFFKASNIICSFTCAVFICYVYSRDSQKLEGKLIEYNNLLKRQATTDPLTGLCNRRSAIEFIETLIDTPNDNGFCVCMCDIDFFKKVNDSYGHDIGDAVLKGVAKEMLEGFPKGCLISRWGGEEFLTIFPNMNGDDAVAILEVMRNKIKSLKFYAGEKEFKITVTYGLAEYDYKSDADALVKEADSKLYIGKENGRDRVVF